MKMYGVLGFEREEPQYEYFELEIEFRYDYRPGRMYLSNGDPGYPEETNADIWQIFNEDKIPSWITDEMIDEEFEIQLPRLLEKAQEDYYEE
jgi:hypothetical protein